MFQNQTIDFPWYASPHTLSQLIQGNKLNETIYHFFGGLIVYAEIEANLNVWLNDVKIEFSLNVLLNVLATNGLNEQINCFEMYLKCYLCFKD